MDFPATRDETVEEAMRRGAPESVLKALRRMPPVDYHSRAEVLRSAAVKEELPPPSTPPGPGTASTSASQKPCASRTPTAAEPAPSPRPGSGRRRLRLGPVGAA
ncbi:MAG: DUF2795 domain-containing protein, partial [Blastococcus sp.]